MNLAVFKLRVERFKDKKRWFLKTYVYNIAALFTELYFEIKTIYSYFAAEGCVTRQLK